MIRTKSALEPRRSEDGYRILVEPVWPHKMPKGKAGGADWMKTLYPSHNLRDWMRRNPRKVSSFIDKYLLELAANDAAVDKVCKMHQERGTITILTPPAEDEWRIYETLVRYLRTMCE